MVDLQGRVWVGGHLVWLGGHLVRCLLHMNCGFVLSGFVLSVVYIELRGT